MKVLIFTTQFYQLGGAERLAVELAQELNRRGIRADILSMYAKDLPGVAEATDALLNMGIPAVHFLDMSIHPSITAMFPAILRLRRLIREQEYDIVETSLTSPIVLASWAVRGMRARQVTGLHQVFLLGRENSPQQRILRLSTRCNRHIRYYSISDYAAGHWIRYSRSSASKMRRIYNGIPEDCFKTVPDREGVRRELGLPMDTRIVLYAGRRAASKGNDTLLDALAPVLLEWNMTLVYVGQPDLSDRGTGEMLQSMEQRMAGQDWARRVLFLGFRKDVPRLMASADVLAHPARMEGFGLVLVEAMAAGLPVVASDVEAIPEVLAGTLSMMVPPDDPDALRKAIFETLERAPADAAKALELGKRRAEDFRKEKRAEMMIALFEDVLAGRF